VRLATGRLANGWSANSTCPVERFARSAARASRGGASELGAGVGRAEGIGNGVARDVGGGVGIEEGEAVGVGGAATAEAATESNASNAKTTGILRT
jgi:hypothetical protein